MVIKKICLHCSEDWDLCQGYYCQCWDGICCDKFNSEDMKYKAFWYKEVKK